MRTGDAAQATGVGHPAPRDLRLGHGSGDALPRPSKRAPEPGRSGL